jgi:hypothetical protein
VLPLFADNNTTWVNTHCQYACNIFGIGQKNSGIRAADKLGMVRLRAAYNSALSYISLISCGHSKFSGFLVSASRMHVCPHSVKDCSSGSGGSVGIQGLGGARGLSSSARNSPANSRRTTTATATCGP